MSANVQRVVELVHNLRRAPQWTAQSIGDVVGVEMRRDQGAPANAKVYLASGDALFPIVRFWQPIFGVSKSARLQLDVTWEQHISVPDLHAIIPGGSPRRMHPPPTPGSNGPARMAFSLSSMHPAANVGFSFESLDASKPYLFAINMKRELPPSSSDDWAPSLFRPYAVQPGDSSRYAIDWRESGEGAIEIDDFRLADRTLSLTFTILEPRIGEILARALIRVLLLDGLLREQLVGKFERVAYRASELGSTVTEAAGAYSQAPRHRN